MKRLLASPYLWTAIWLGFGLLICFPAVYYGLPGAGWCSAEWLLLGIWLGLRPTPGSQAWKSWLWWGFWALLIFLQVYALFIWRLYRVGPNFYHEWSLLTEVLPIFWSELSLGKLSSYLPMMLAALFGIILTASLLARLRRQRHNWGGVPGGSIILLLCLIGLQVSGKLKWTSADLFINIQSSRQLYQDVHQLPDLSPFQQNWSDSLIKKPDIYLIFLESYGKVLTTNQRLQTQYQALIEEVEANLKVEGWGMRSTWSESPISGGRSWLGFTSVMTGKKLYAHPQYTALLNEQPDYPHLVRYLNDQGYFSLRMNTLKAETQAARIPYALYERFFAFDQWLKYPDFPYQGPAYGKFGNLPDQYALAYAREKVIGDRHPFFMFFITLNSHSPWNDIPLLTDDWQELAQLPDTAQAGQESSLMAGLAEDKYGRAMDYQVRMMAQFVEQQGDSNSLFVFLGDHQPPFLTDAEDDFACQVHVFSQDAEVLAAFGERSFTPGLSLDESSEVAYQHEDLYLLLREVLSAIQP